MDRMEAIDCGFSQYDSSDPCRKCKSSVRYTKNRACVACSPTNKIKAERPLSERSRARMRGFKTYKTGKMCINGHNAPRYTSSGACSKCVNPPRKYLIVRLEVHKDDVTTLQAYALALKLSHLS